MNYIGKSINANQIDGITTLTGKLYFYEEGYVFKAQSVNAIQDKPKVFYKDIEEIRLRKTLGIIPNGIIVCLKDGKCLNYVVTKRKEIVSFLNGMIKASEG